MYFSRRGSSAIVFALRVGTDSVMPASSVRDLGISINSDASVKTHTSETMSSCFAVLHQIRSIRPSVSQQTLQSLVVSLVLTCLDYSNAALAGMASNQLDRLQSVMNAAAWFVCSARKCDHITPLLQDLHWLRVSQQVEFKLAVACMVWLRHTLHENCAMWQTWTHDGDFVPLQRSS